MISIVIVVFGLTIVTVSAQEFYVNGTYCLIGENFTDIPDNIPTDAIRVVILQMKITIIKANVFENLSKCMDMVLWSNDIIEIEPGVFHGLETL